LILAGWDEIPAMLIAADRTIDLHRACDLVEKCGPEKAWAIIF